MFSLFVCLFFVKSIITHFRLSLHLYQINKRTYLYNIPLLFIIIATLTYEDFGLKGG